MTPTHTPAQSRITDKISGKLLMILALLSAVAPLATDLYLPAFPDMAVSLNTDATTIQLTLTGFLVGVAVGQLVFGPLSDRFGRFPPLLIGTILTIVASIVAVTAQSVELLIIARAVQGLGGAAGMVIGRAIISDRATGVAAARAFSIMMIVGGVAPIVGPLAGGLLADAVGWRGLLGIVLGLTVLMLVAVLGGIRESYPREAREADRKARSTAGSPLKALKSRQYLGYTISYALAFTVMMSYISASPFLYQTMMGFTELQYGLAFAVNAIGLVIVSAISAKLVQRYNARHIVALGITLVFVGSLGLLVLAVSGVAAIVLALPVFVAIAGLGFVLGNATALALAAVPRASGTGSAVLGAAQFGFGAIVAPFVSIAGENTAVPLAIIMVGAATLSLVSYSVARITTVAPTRTETGSVVTV